jgi:N-acetylneuraminic acid mutarotase
MKKISSFPGMLIIGFAVLFCARQNEFDFPLIQTGEVTDIDVTGALFHARITDLSNDNIVEYGFVWSVNENPDVSSSKVTISEAAKTGLISLKVTSDFLAGSAYYVRAYARNNRYITYGKAVKFISKGSLAPVIIDFNPKEGSSSTQVTITGENFSGSLTGNIVKFGNVIAVILEASTDKLIVSLPSDLAVSGVVNIFVKTANQLVKSRSTFNLSGCNILHFEPSVLIGGDIIHLKVENFSSYLLDNTLRIGEIDAEIINISNDTITAYIPYNAVAGSNEISLTSNGRTCYAIDLVTVKNPWKTIESNMAFLRSAPSGFSIEGNGYVGFGSNPNSTMFYDPYKDLWEFNSDNITWKKCADLPEMEREDAASFSIRGKGYICLGNYGGNIFFKDLFEYNPVNDSWTKKSDFPGVDRIGAICVVIGDKAYVGMGIGVGGLGLLRDFWEYDPSFDKWTQMMDYPGTAGNEMVCFSINEKGYIGLGAGNLVYPVQKGFWEYDPLSNKWTQLADFPGTERGYSIGFSIGKFGYIGTGWMVSGYGAALSDFWRYDVDNKRWIRIADIPAGGRYESVSFVINDRGYICSGIFPEHDLIEFNPN